MKKRILKYKTEQDWDESEKAICKLLGIPDNKGTERWSDKLSRNEYWYRDYINKGWGGFTAEQILAEAGNYEDCEIEIEYED